MKTASPTTSLAGAEMAQADVDEQVPRRLRPQDPDLEIREVTNDGEAANMEMLIHLKVSIFSVLFAMFRTTSWFVARWSITA